MENNKKELKPAAIVLKDVIDVIIDLAGGSASCWGYYQVKEPTDLLDIRNKKD